MSDTTAQRNPVSVLRRLLRFAPVVSLAIGVTSMIVMRRNPERAPLILAVAVAGWIAVTLASVAVKRLDDDVTKKGRVMRFVAVWLSQYAVQSSLAFPLPFYLRALWPPVAQHALFVVVYAACVVAAFWDPLYQRVARAPAFLVALQGFAAFVACLTVLPIVGLDNGATFLVSGVVVAAGAPLWFFLAGERSRKRGSLSGALGLALAILVVVGAPLVPPAPLSLERAVLCSAVDNKEPVDVKARFAPGDVVVCHTAIRAPLGLKDKLVHVWTVDGRPLQRVPLDVSGGRSHGFRTWSRLNVAPRGRVACRVETALGQVVGAVAADVR